jgi:hypothetical protein
MNAAASQIVSWRLRYASDSTPPSATACRTLPRSAPGTTSAASTTSVVNGVVESGAAAAMTSGATTAVARPAVSATPVVRRASRPCRRAASSATSHASGATAAPTSTLLSWAAANVVPRSAIGTAARNAPMGIQISNAGFGNTSGGVA